MNQLAIKAGTYKEGYVFFLTANSIFILLTPQQIADIRVRCLDVNVIMFDPEVLVNSKYE